jgi:hypothetical protein
MQQLKHTKVYSYIKQNSSKLIVNCMLVFMLSQLVQAVLHSVQDGVMLNMNKALQINEQIVISMPWCIVKRVMSMVVEIHI